MTSVYPEGLSFGADSRVVLVGTTRCPRDETYLPPLPQVEQNIRYLERLFTDPDIVGLPRGTIVTLLDLEEANRIGEGIAEAARAATDTLIVYYAGHGLFGDADTPLYLAAANSTDADKAFNAVPISLVKKAMQASPATKRVLILDCCYSGRAFDGGMSATSPEEAAKPAVDLDGTYGIAAAPRDAKAYAPPHERLTRFTGALVDTLEHGIDREQPTLTLDEVFREVETRIGRRADAPLPRRVNGMNGGFLLARNRSLRSAGLRRLNEALEGLRTSLATTGAAQQRTEARLAGLEALAGRVEALEATQAALAGRLAGLETVPHAPPVVEDDPAAPWSRVGVPLGAWKEMPASLKGRVQSHFAGRRNAVYLGAGMAYLAGLAVLGCFSPELFGRATPSATLGWLKVGIGSAALLTATGVLLAAAAYATWLQPSEGRPWPPLQDPLLQQLLDTNELLNDILHRRVIRLFEVELAWSRTCLIALAALAIGPMLLAIAVPALLDLQQELRPLAAPPQELGAPAPPPVGHAP